MSTLNSEVYAENDSEETPDHYKQVHRTTEAKGEGQTPTPIEGYVSKTGDDFYLNIKGADGQQVADLILQALGQIPKKKESAGSGFCEWAFGLVLCSIASVAIVNSLAPSLNPNSQSNPQPVQTQPQ